MPRQCPHTITLTATPAIDTRLDGSMFFEPNLHKTRKFFPVFSYAILVNLAEGANVVVFTICAFGVAHILVVTSSVGQVT